MKEIKRVIAEWLTPETFKKVKDLNVLNTILDNKLATLQKQNLVLTQKYKDEKQLSEDLKKDLLEAETTPIDKFCKDNFTLVAKFAYKDKLEYKGKFISVYPNELITPKAFLINKAKQHIITRGKFKNFKEYIEFAAQWVDNQLIWTDDQYTHKAVDRYSYPIQALTSGKEDCEAHAHVLASIDPDYIAVAFGYAGKTGHAFNVTVINNKLYVVETNSKYDKNKNVKVVSYNQQKYYKILYIFTQKHTYKVGKHKTHFGDLVR